MDDIEKKDLEVGTESPILNSSPSPSIRAEEKRSTVDQPPLHRHATNSSSIRSKSYYPPIVPRAERRGLLARFSVVPETTQTYLYPRRTKWFITFTIALAAAAAPMGSAIIVPTLIPIARDFHVSPTVTNLSVALYMLSMSIFPLWWSSFSETLGRRTIYIVSFVLFVIFGALSAIATNIGMLIAMRVLSGGAAASVQAVGAGTIADIWEPKERGKAMGIFYLGPLCGPLFAPIIGGALAQKFGWRATQWFLAIYGGVILVFLTFALPETLRVRKSIVEQAKEDGDLKTEAEVAVQGAADNPAALKTTTTLQRTATHRSVAQKSAKYVRILKRCFLDPLKIVLLLRFPAVAITCYYASITFGSLYFLNISIETTFSHSPYNFPTVIIGLLYIPNSLGYFLASIFGGRWLDYIMKREAKRKGRVTAEGKLILKPEDRMRENAWIAGFVFPAALVWYGWSAEKGVHWIVPMIANFFFGLGSMIVFAMATTMLTEFMPRRASTGIAVNNFLRNIFSCIGGIVADPLIRAIGNGSYQWISDNTANTLIRAIGNGWLCTILGIVALISGCLVIWAMKKYGEKWREEMDEKLKD